VSSDLGHSSNKCTKLLFAAQGAGRTGGGELDGAGEPDRLRSRRWGQMSSPITHPPVRAGAAMESVASAAHAVAGAHRSG